MSYKNYRMIQAINGGILGAIFAVSISFGNWIIPIIAVIVSLVILTILRRSVKEIISDERTYAIREKSSLITLQIGVVGMAVAGAVLLGISRDSTSTLGQIAITLEYITCALLIISYVTYYYYKNKLGGRNE